MMYYKLGVLLTYFLGGTTCRDNARARPLKNLPAITNSLVNFGKIDVAVHFNSKLPPPSSTEKTEPASESDEKVMFQPFSNNAASKARFTEVPCPCTGLRDLKSTISSNPSNLLDIILKSNDLFSFNEDPHVSTSCCGSHENLHSEVIFEIDGPAQSRYLDINPKPRSNPKNFPFVLDSLLSNNEAMPMKKNAIEIFFLPNMNESTKKINFKPHSNQKKPLLKKKDIKIVGDKELRNDFNYRELKTLSNPLPSLETKDRKKYNVNQMNQIYDIRVSPEVKEVTSVIKKNKIDKEPNINVIINEVIHAAKMPLSQPQNQKEPKNSNIEIDATKTIITSKPN